MTEPAEPPSPDESDGTGEAVPNASDAPEAEPGVDDVTAAVLAASRLLIAVSARSLAAVTEGVTLPQFRLLMVLAAHGDAKLVQLAERLGVNPSTAMRMLDRLIAAGLADRQSNPANRRETMLRLTPEGRRLVAEVKAARHREVAAIVQRLSPGQRSALVTALAAFTEAGGEPAIPGDTAEAYPPGWSDTHPRHAS
ncbi:MarR family transcriptional regulator [Streptomyces sp. AcH 505]|uniref:MarR family transcriptional regulator n=1 Tax=Streptomyces sp. AcH 505 TaxID=352211 RepID=UPI00099C5D5F